MYQEPKKKGGIIILFIIVFFLLSYYVSNYTVKLNSINVVSKSVPVGFDDFKILQLTDLHSMDFGNSNQDILKYVNEQEPDVVVMTGDMISTQDTSYDVFYNLLKNISANYQVLYIVGNHEQNLGEEKLGELTSKVEELGAMVLDNKGITLESNGDKLNIYGMWFNLRYYRDLSSETSDEYFFGIEQMNEVIGPAPTEGYTVLLTHNPVYADTYAEWGANLTLSGHLHGGMIYVPFKGGLFSPEKQLFPKYYGGTFSVDNMILFVSTGLGRGGMGFRLFNRPEVCSITLKTVNE